MRQIPNNLTAEQSVIGSLLIDFNSERCQSALRSIKTEYFYNHQHQVIFGEILAMNAARRPVDGLTLTDSLEKKGVLKDVGGFAYISELAKNTPNAANVRAYANIIKDSAVERNTLNRLQDAIAVIFESSTQSTEEKLTEINRITTEINDFTRVSRTGLTGMNSVVTNWLNTVESRQDNTNRGLSTGIKALDDLLGFKKLVRGSLLVVGARPKMGKTTLLNTIMLNCAFEENLPALAFSLEMTADQLLERMIAQKAGVNTDVFYGDYDDEEFAKGIGAAGRLAENDNLFVDDTPAIDLNHIRLEARRIKREKGNVGLILVDYLTLMSPEKAERNDLAFGAVTRGLKQLAKELNCVVVLATQLNRKLEDRADKRPFPSDSRDTGQIEQDCDYWIGIYRDSVYNENADSRLTELLLRLNRHGGTGSCYVNQFNGAMYEVDQEAVTEQLAQEESKNKSYREKYKGGF